MTGLSLCLLAARATGTVILDGVFNDVKDADGFAAECVQGRQLGFDGKTLIHPGQVELCNATFAPSPEAVEDAHGVLAATIFHFQGSSLPEARAFLRERGYTVRP